MAQSLWLVMAIIYLVLKNFVLWVRSKISGSALEFCVQNHKFQAPRQKDGGQANYK
jgi:hypothetical protein